MVRFGIVGFGLHAVKRLMPGFALSKRCQVIALSRRDLAAAKQSAAQHKIPLAFDSARDLCASSEVDAVLVTTPNACHLDDVLTAIAAGKPVLCEKPLAVSAEECKRMVEAARAGGVLLGVAQVFRFNESVRAMREWASAARVGRLVFARGEFSFAAGSTHPRKWIYDAAIAGGGPILDVGVHCVDTLRFVLGDEVVRVSARAVSDEGSGTVESAASLTLEFSRGTLGNIAVSYRAAYRTPIELVGEHGVVRADNALNVEHPIEIQFLRDGTVEETKTTSNRQAYALQVDAFAEAIEGKSEFPIPGEEGWRNQQLLDAALRSARSGKVEEVPPVA
jgi:predicted dehydrogenase